MNNEPEIEETPSIHDLVKQGREKLAHTKDESRNTLTVLSDYVRANPWLAIAGAFLCGTALASLNKSRRRQSKLEVVRAWLDETYAKMPSSKQVQSTAERLPQFLAQLKKQLHLS